MEIYKKMEGFSMIELLISLFILSFVLLAMATHVSMTIKTNWQSKLATEANILAQDKLENLKRVKFDSLNIGGDLITVYGTTFVRSWIVSNLDNLKKIDITVTFNSKNIKISTLRASEI
jgi:type II secretory pathway pseudopilin PulG